MPVSDLTSDLDDLVSQVVSGLSGRGYSMTGYATEPFNSLLAAAGTGLGGSSLSILRAGRVALLSNLLTALGGSGSDLTETEMLAQIINSLEEGDGGGGVGSFYLLEDGSGHYRLEDGSGALLLEVALGGIAASENSSTPNGSRWFFGDTFYVGPEDVPATGHVTETSPAHHAAFTITDLFQGDVNSITAVVTGASGTFRVAGDKTKGLFPGAVFLVGSSTGNNGFYTVASSVFSSGNTTVTVTGSVPNATVDGVIGSLAYIAVAGNHVADLALAFLGCIRISGSTGNDDIYTSLRNGVLVGGSTYVQVNAGLADPTVDGTFIVGGGILTYAIDTAGDGYLPAEGIPLHATGGSVGTGADINVTEVT